MISPAPYYVCMQSGAESFEVGDGERGVEESKDRGASVWETESSLGSEPDRGTRLVVIVTIL